MVFKYEESAKSIVISSNMDTTLLQILAWAMDSAAGLETCGMKPVGTVLDAFKLNWPYGLQRDE